MKYQFLIKGLFVMAVALFFSVIAFSNLVDYNTNWLFVKTVLSMKKVNQHSPLLWRSINTEWLQKTFYNSIILLEIVIAIICWVGGYKLIVRQRKNVALTGLGLAFLFYFLVFCVGASEWFEMWQYNKIGQHTAFVVAM